MDMRRGTQGSAALAPEPVGGDDPRLLRALWRRARGLKRGLNGFLPTAVVHMPHQLKTDRHVRHTPLTEYASSHT